MVCEADLGSLSLKKLTFKETGEEGKNSLDYDFNLKAAATEIVDEILSVSWDLSFVLKSLFTVEAKYEMYVIWDKKQGRKIDTGRIVQETGLPVLSEFSLLLALLTKAGGGIPLAVQPEDLLERAGFSIK
ncbi:MAG: hypothetical protein GX335_01755 [Firmicutes bacterium]|nr:hypothetical protein [Bacillota bacterium]